VNDLYRYVDQKQLTSEFHGSLQFNQQDWIHQQLVNYYYIVSTFYASSFDVFSSHVAVMLFCFSNQQSAAVYYWVNVGNINTSGDNAVKAVYCFIHSCLSEDEMCIYPSVTFSGACTKDFCGHGACRRVEQNITSILNLTGSTYDVRFMAYNADQLASCRLVVIRCLYLWV